MDEIIVIIWLTFMKIDYTYHTNISMEIDHAEI